LNIPIYEQSVNVRKMVSVWWHDIWQILASYVGTAYCCRLRALEIAKFGNFRYKFSPNGYIPIVILQNLA